MYTSYLKKMFFFLHFIRLSWSWWCSWIYNYICT